MTQEEANKIIAEKLEEIKKLLVECRVIAHDNNCDFEYGLMTDTEGQAIKDYYRNWQDSGCTL